MKRGWLIAILAVAISGVAFGYPGLGKLSMDQTAISRIFEAYVEAQNAQDLESWIKLWDQDGVKLAPGVPTVYGRPAIYERAKASFASTLSRKMTIELHEIVVMGDYAFADGTYAVTSIAKATGAPGSTDAKFMTVLKKQPDGTWLIYRDTTNSNR